jgi:quinol monooxygenase YgiN
MADRKLPVLTDTVVTVRESGREAFLVLTRLYLQQTRREPGVLRCELLERDGAPAGEYVLHEAFRSKDARAAHLTETHTHQYAGAVKPLLTAQPEVTHFSVLAREALPPPLPASKSRQAWERSGRFSVQWPHGAGSSQPAPIEPPRLRVLLHRLELAVATESRPLAGRADPCLVTGAFLLHAGTVEVLGRSLIRLKLASDVPCVIESQDALIDVRLLSDAAELTILVLMIGLEENGGRDVQRAYQSLEVPEALRVWAPTAAMPDPVSLAELATNRAKATLNAQPVELLLSGQLLSEAFEDDAWAGAALHVLTIDGAFDDTITRFHLGAKPDKNDWVVSALTQIGR